MTPRSIAANLNRLSFLKYFTWLAFTGLLVITLGLSSCSILNPVSFEMVGGDEQVFVLLRNEEVGNYQIRYGGRNQTDLRSLKVMLGGQILHADVQQVAILHEGQEIVLEGDGTLPAGSQIVLSPGDEFEVKVTYLGQTPGGNYMYGFRIGYGDDPQEEPQDLISEFDFSIIVE